MKDYKLYVVKVDSPIEKNLFDFWLNILDEERKQIILLQRIKQNADNMLVGDILKRYMIKITKNIDMSKQEIRYANGGKPYMVSHSDICFNISHSGKYVVGAISDEQIGVDIQKIGVYKENVAKYVCSVEELELINASTDRNATFTEIWTKKEAYVKMLGCGVGGVELKKIPIYRTDSIRLDDYFLSVCTRRMY